MIFDWILSIRSDALTAFFKIAPLLSNDYFYIAFVAFSYHWHPYLARSLGFLVPFSILLNCLLKHIFQIPRPSVDFHLMPVLDPFGFPSGDAQIASVFWLMLFLYFKNYPLRFLCFLPLINIMLSRIYFGIHSIYDVLGGLAFALCTLYIWHFHLKHPQTLLVNSYKFWGTILLTVGLYIFASWDLSWSPLVSISLGALTGFYIVLRQEKLSFRSEWFLGCAGLLGVFLIEKSKPLIANPFFLHSAIILKYTFMIIGAFFSVFYILSKIRPKT